MSNISRYISAPAILSALALSACSDDQPVLTHRDLDGTDTFFASAEAQSQNIYYKPYVGYVGDPMPFFDPVDKNFKVLYLQDYRPNQAVTYHPIWAVETSDAASYTSLGEIVPTGTASELDAAIGTGSTIYHEGTYYTFYTAHSPNPATTAGINEAVMLATSTDFRTWTKDRSVLIDGGDTYSRTDFRDPFVYRADDGSFHMLVSTRLGGKGVLAEYTSTDLRDWTSAGVFMTMMWDRFYECPDLFRMGDWWYLVYSEQHDAIRRVQYFKGRTIDELRACTANDAGLWPDSHEGFLDSRGFYAGKTASDGTDRYIWGWCATRAGSSTVNAADWAGNLVAHKLMQRADGTLYTTEVPAIASMLGQARTIAGFSLSGNESRLMPRLGTENRIEFTVTASSAHDRFGMSFARGSDSEKYYSIIVNPENGDTRKINLEEEGGIGFIPDTDGYTFATPADGVYHITIVTDNSVITVYINDAAAFTTRIYGTLKNCWSINSYGADINISDITLQSK
ncbi:MAG: DUF4975 domain-containing protein [Muribaculaceae bacterium]|nr:DUF4975 domain-containing protein [Muribaculaceae bacterium]